MELRQWIVLVVNLCFVGSATGESGFLVTAPQKFTAETTEKVCATFFDLQDKSLTLRIKQGRRIRREVSGTPTGDDLCLDVQVPAVSPRPSSSYQSRESSTQDVELTLEVEVSGRSRSGAHFIETQEKTIHLSNVNKLETYIQTDKPIYKAGQTVKFRILTLEYPDLKPHIQKIRRIYVEEPGGRRVQQWTDVETRVGLADMEMPLSPEPPLGNWTIFAAVGQKKVRKTFEVGEYVLPKFGVNIIPQPAYVYKEAEDVNVKICGVYSYGEPVRGSIEANFTLAPSYSYSWLPQRPVITKMVEDTGSDGCHTFNIPSSSLEVQAASDEYRDYKLNVQAAFTETGTDLTLTGSSEETKLVKQLYSLVIDGPDTFKPGLPYHGVIRLTYPDKFPVSEEDVQVMFRNYEGGTNFEQTMTVTITGGVGSFTLTPPRSAAHTKLKIEAVVLSHTDIRTQKYLQAYFSPSGNFLEVAPMAGGKQSGQTDSIDVDFTIPTDQQTITFYYKIMSRSNIVHSGQQSWTGSVTPPVQPQPVEPIIPIVPEVEQPSIPIQPVPRGNFDPDVRGFPGPGGRPQNPPLKRRLKRYHNSYSRTQETVEEPSFPYYQTVTTARVSFPFTVSAQMGPKSRVLVYYICHEGEVVSGKGEFTVANSFDNQVSLEFGSSEARPGAQVQLSVNAAPQSLCAVGVVDKSVHLLRDSNQLTAKKVETPLHGFNALTFSNPSSHCSSSSSSPRPEWRFRRDTSQTRDKRRSEPYRPDRGNTRTSLFSRHLDAIEAFKNAGLVVLTNFEVENRPCYKRITTIYRDYYYRRVEGLPGRPGSPMGLPNAPMGRPGPMGNPGWDQDYGLPVPMFNEDIRDEQDSDVLEIPTDNEIAEDETSVSSPLVEIRSYFPETWLWLLTVTSESGSAIIDSEVPHTITDWVANGFCTSTEAGFGIADPVELRAFQPFFLSYNLPYSAIREEQIPVDVTVFNYLTDCFTIQLSIDESSDFSLIDTSRNKYVCVCDRESKTVNYTIIPRSLGDIKITVHGNYVPPGFNVPMCGNNAFLPTVNGVRDAIEDTLLIEPEGVEREETFSELVCVEKGENFTATVPLSLPHDVIPDSARGRVFVTGDMMGSVLSNLDSILRMPTGCGEQNMVLFAPNIYVLQYLTSTDQLTAQIQNKALQFLNVGYQRELTYRLRDGSYSAFGQSDGEGSTWLTAFVLKSFVQANMFITIDTKDITVTRNWLLRQQKPDSGCFRNRGVLRHQSMKGGVSDEVTLTAYVLVSLLEAGVEPDDSKVLLAEQCITARLTEVYNDPYALALVTYALLLAENPNGHVGLQQLDTLAQTESGGLKYWKRIDNEPVETDCHYCQQPSASVEMTSYALLAYITSDDKDVADAVPIVRWMNKQRSALGGYSSTQDTVMGLQSLSLYASEVYRNDTNMAIDVSKSGAGVFMKRFVVNGENKILSQRLELDEVPVTLTFDARGDGCALVQAQLRYNVPAVRITRREPFEITLDMTPPDTVQHCGKKTLTTCIRYLGTRDSTSMAAVEFKMVTGYYVDMESLGLYLQKYGHRIGLKRIDPPKKGQPLVLYFDQFDQTQRCFEVEVKQKMFVDSAKAASIKVYDYYEPGVKSYKSYNTCPPKEDKDKNGGSKDI